VGTFRVVSIPRSNTRYEATDQMRALIWHNASQVEPSPFRPLAHSFDNIALRT